MEALEEKYPQGVFFGSVNVDDAPDLAGRFGVMSVPTVVFLQNGEELTRKVGKQSLESYSEVLDQRLAT